MNMTDEELLAEIDENFAGWHYEKPGDVDGSEGHLLDLLHQCRERIAGDGWVSVDESVPQDDSVVAVYVSHPGLEPYVSIGWYVAGGEWRSTYILERGEKVTHWKPLHGPEGV